MSDDIFPEPPPNAHPSSRSFTITVHVEATSEAEMDAKAAAFHQHLTELVGSPPADREGLSALAARVEELEAAEQRRQAIIREMEAQRAAEPNPIEEARNALRATREASSFFPNGFGRRA